MTRARRKPVRDVPIRSRIARTSRDRIVVRGHNLATELIGKVDLGEMAFLMLRGRLPTEHEARLFNAVLVTLVEHGLTPSVLAARLTYLGSPEALQAAVAAGLLGIGSQFVGTTEDVAQLLQEALSEEAPVELEPVARDVVARYRSRAAAIPGIGHPLHKTADPRAKRLFDIADEEGYGGRYVALMRLIAQEAERALGRALPINATGAIGAVMSELGLPWHDCRAVGLMARTIGVVAHLQEERDHPIAMQIWLRAEAESSSVRSRS
jgi:citrate synthase